MQRKLEKLGAKIKKGGRGGWMHDECPRQHREDFPDGSLVLALCHSFPNRVCVGVGVGRRDNQETNDVATAADQLRV